MGRPPKKKPIQNQIKSEEESSIPSATTTSPETKAESRPELSQLPPKEQLAELEREYTAGEGGPKKRGRKKKEPVQTPPVVLSEKSRLFIVKLTRNAINSICETYAYNNKPLSDFEGDSLEEIGNELAIKYFSRFADKATEIAGILLLIEIIGARVKFGTKKSDPGPGEDGKRKDDIVKENPVKVEQDPNPGSVV